MRAAQPFLPSSLLNLPVQTTSPPSWGRSESEGAAVSPVPKSAPALPSSPRQDRRSAGERLSAHPTHLVFSRQVRVGPARPSFKSLLPSPWLCYWCYILDGASEIIVFLPFLLFCLFSSVLVVAMENLADATSQFALDLFQKLNEAHPTGNVFFSPVSISSALAMIYLGARGNTAAQISEVSRYFSV